MNIIEQMIIPKRPTYIERYIQGEGEKVGNVKIVRVGESEVKPYNPYSFDIRELVTGNVVAPESDVESSDESEGTSDVDSDDFSESSVAGENIPKKSLAGPYKIKEPLNRDIYPSMPEIDSTFEEEPYFKQSSILKSQNMFVAGFLRTGIPGYESPLIKGTFIGTR
jgi:hypothetical protein